MRLAVIAHHVAPIAPPFAGGVESLTWYLTRWLARQGHDVTLFAPPGSAVPGVTVRELELELELSTAARSDVSMPPVSFMAAHHAYQCLMLELADGAPYDLVHSHSLHYLPVGLAPLLEMPTVLTLHTPPTPWLESALRSRRGAAPHLTAVSRATAALWADVVPVADVIRNGIDLEAWPAGPGGDGAVWCGRMVPEKAPHLAIDAARQAGVRLRLAGPIVDAAYWEAAVAPRLGEDVRYVGHLGHEDLAALLGSAEVALQTPVWEEPFGLAAAEAMATGTPVAAFGRGGLRSVVEPGGGALARPDDVPDLARAIRSAARLDRAEVRAHARARLSIDVMGRRYEALYDHLLVDDRALRAA